MNHEERIRRLRKRLPKTQYESVRHALSAFGAICLDKSIMPFFDNSFIEIQGFFFREQKDSPLLIPHSKIHFSENGTYPSSFQVADALEHIPYIMPGFNPHFLSRDFIAIYADEEGRYKEMGQRFLDKFGCNMRTERGKITRFRDKRGLA